MGFSAWIFSWTLHGYSTRVYSRRDCKGTFTFVRYNVEDVRGQGVAAAARPLAPAQPPRPSARLQRRPGTEQAQGGPRPSPGAGARAGAALVGGGHGLGDDVRQLACGIHSQESQKA